MNRRLAHRAPPAKTTRRAPSASIARRGLTTSNQSAVDSRPAYRAPSASTAYRAPSASTAYRAPSASIARGAIGLLTTQPFTWAASLLTTAMLPRYLGEAGFGQLAVITTVTALGGAIASLGMHDYMKRRIAMQPARTTVDASAAILLVSVAAVLIGSGLFFVLPLLGFTGAERAALGVALCGMVVQAAQGVVLAVLVGQERHARYAWLNAASVVISSCAGVAVLAAGGGILGYLSTATIAAAILTAVFWRYSGLELVWAGGFTTARELFAGGLPFLGWNIARLVRAQIDVVLVGLLLHEQAAGWLAAAYRIIAVVVFFPTIITTPLLPVLSREAGNTEVFRRVLRRSVSTVLIFTIPAAAFIIALAPLTPDLLGWAPGFHHATPLMMILAVQQPLIAIDMVLGTALIALGRERRWLSVMVAAAIFNPGFNLVAIPLADHLFQNGAVGAAVVELGTELVMMTGALILLPRGILDRSSATECLRIVLAGTFLALVVVALRDLSLPIAVVAGGVAFLATAFGLRVVGPSDISMVRQTVFQSFAIPVIRTVSRQVRTPMHPHVNGQSTAGDVSLGALVASDIAAWNDTWAGSVGVRSRVGLLTTSRLVWLFPGLRATFLYRVSHALHRRGIKVLPQLVSQLNLMLHGLDIPASIPIGPRLYIPHPVGIVVMAERIGTNVTLVSSITIGMRKGPGFPNIGDNVYIGAGARVLGSIVIGSNVSIGANAVVLRDVPDDSVAVGVPAQVRSTTDADITQVGT